MYNSQADHEGFLFSPQHLKGANGLELGYTQQIGSTGSRDPNQSLVPRKLPQLLAQGPFGVEIDHRALGNGVSKAKEKGSGSSIGPRLPVVRLGSRQNADKIEISAAQSQFLSRCDIALKLAQSGLKFDEFLLFSLNQFEQIDGFQQPFGLACDDFVVSLVRKGFKFSFQRLGFSFEDWALHHGLPCRFQR